MKTLLALLVIGLWIFAALEIVLTLMEVTP